MEQVQNGKKMMKAKKVGEKGGYVSISQGEYDRLRENRRALVGPKSRDNHYANQVFRPESTKAKGFPDAIAPMTHSCHTVDVTEITATADAQDFSVQIWPDPENLIGVSQGTFSLPANTALSAGDAYSTDLFVKPYFNVSNTPWAPGEIGGAVAVGTTATYNLRGNGDVSAGPDNSFMKLKSANGQAQLSADPEGWILIPSGTGAITFVATATWNAPATSTPTQGRMTISDDVGVIGTATVNSTQVETYAFTTTAPAGNRIRISYQPNGIASGGNRIVQSLTMNLSFANATTMIPDYAWQPQTSVANSLKAKQSKLYRVVAQTVLASCDSSDFSNGGKIAGSAISPYNANGPSEARVVLYPEVASLVTSKKNALKFGLWGFRENSSQLDREFRGLEFDRWGGLEFMVLAGVFATVGGSLKIEVHTHWELCTLDQILGPEPSRVAPAEIAFVEEFLSALPVHFTENPTHPVFQKIFAKASELWKAGKPYLPYVLSAAKALAPVAAGLLL